MGLKDVFKKKEQTAQQKAQRSKFSTGIKLVACAYLVYMAWQLITLTRAGETGMSMTTAYIITGVIILAILAVIALTVVEALQKYRTGAFKEELYMTDEEREQRRQELEAERLAEEAEAREDGEYDDVSADEGDPVEDDEEPSEEEEAGEEDDSDPEE